MDIKHHIIKNFVFQNGTVLPLLTVAYADINPSKTKTALVVSCFRGRIATTCTFSSQDLNALSGHRIICVALLGNGESSSPSNAPDFPLSSLDYRDCVRAQYDLLARGLGIAALDIIIGYSMGGQAVYYWSLMHPEMVHHAVVICSAARTSGHNVQFLEGPRVALENSIDYVPRLTSSASSASYKPCVRGLRAFGKAYSAWLTSAEWFEQERYRTLGYASQKEWDEAVTRKGYDGWDPDDLLAMLGMWQRGDITVLRPGRTLISTLGEIRARVLLIPCQTDQYFKWAASEREHKAIPDSMFKVISSIWGHMGGSGASKEDIQWIDQQITLFLR